MGTKTIPIIELSQPAYDEIEKLLLESGYEHLFDRGPGSLIDMGNFLLDRRPDPPHVTWPRALSEPPDCGVDKRRPKPEHEIVHDILWPDSIPNSMNRHMPKGDA